MELLLDTHCALWWWQDSPKLSQVAREKIANPANKILFSAVSSMEICTKVRIGKLHVAEKMRRDLSGAVALSGWQELPISIQHGQIAGELDWNHRDPFDRLLAAQSISDSLVLLSCDDAFASIEVKTLW